VTDRRQSRAKIKNIAKKSIESGEDCNDIPESMRRYLALQATEGKPGFGNIMLGRSGFGNAYGNGMLLNTDPASTKIGKSLLYRNQSRRYIFSADSKQ